MLVASKELLVKARKEGYAIGAFNAGNYATFDAIITAAEELNAPVLVQVGDLLDPCAPESRLMTRSEAENFMQALRGRVLSSIVPIAIHLDHCRTFEGCMRMIALGVSSVMIDASMKPFEENIELAKKVIEAARPCGVTIEAEIGHVSGANDAVDEIYTTVEEAQRFYAETDVDILAVAIGTAHGVYASTPALQYDRIKELKEAIPAPLVMHGASGLSEEQYRICIRNGITKINFATYMSIAGAIAAKKIANSEEDGKKLRFEMVYKAGFMGMKDTVKKHIQIFGSAGKA